MGVAQKTSEVNPNGIADFSPGFLDPGKQTSSLISTLEGLRNACFHNPFRVDFWVVLAFSRVRKPWAGLESAIPLGLTS